MKVRLTPQAAADIKDAQNWYAEQGRPGLDRRFGRALDTALSTLREQPRLYRKVRGRVRHALLPRFPCGLYYLLAGDEIVVLGLRHFAREPID